MSSEMSGDGGQRAEAACACSSSCCFISARRVLLRVPTPGAGAGFCGARQVPRPLLLPCLATGDGVSRTTLISCSGVLSCARGGVIGGVISSITGRYCSATRLAGCDAGGAEEARGRGSSSAGLGRVLCDVSASGVEICTGSSVRRFTGGGSSLTKSKSQRTVWGGARTRWRCLVQFTSFHALLIMSMIDVWLGIAKYLSYGSYRGSELPGCSPC